VSNVTAVEARILSAKEYVLFLRPPLLVTFFYLRVLGRKGIKIDVPYTSCDSDLLVIVFCLWEMRILGR
jgi:hypothetical protein